MATVIGAIRDKWIALGGAQSFLGEPLTNELTCPDGIGKFNHFQHGSIYWTPQTGAHEVHGAIREKWASLSWETGLLGYPLTDETTTPDGVGRFNHFQHGSIYWTPRTGANEVHGAIREKWASLGWETGLLGYPLTDETTTPDSVGKFNNFERGQIAWSPQFGAGVSALNSPQTQTISGLRPAGIAGINDSTTIEVRRRVVCSANMNLIDHETFGSNERGSASGDGEVIITNGHPEEVIPKLIGTAGGEMRVELALTGSVRDNGDVNIIGKAVLFEGTSVSTNDEDGNEDINILIPRDSFRRYSVRVNNEDEGGDFADITMTFSNFPA